MEDSGFDLFNKIQEGDLAAFELLHKKYYVYLRLIAKHIVKNSDDAEEIVSDVFVKLWNNRKEIGISTSIKAYIIKAVQNTAINYLEKNKLATSLSDSLSTVDYSLLAWDSDYPLGQLYEKDIQEIMVRCINILPESCRKIFLLSRNEELTYSDIASELGISVNTVKMQIKIALARLREALKDYIHLLLLLKGF
jgi:RNA polymerase sigma-70 factor (ECF subfamily)